MAKFKVHKTGPLNFVEGMPEAAALCKTTHRTLLPLRLTDDWRDVTCDRCNRKRPKARSMWQRLLGWVYSFKGRA